MIKKKPLPERDSEDRYRERREAARNLLMPEPEELAGVSLRLSDITSEALLQATQWRRLYGLHGRGWHRPGWDWETETRRFRKKAKRIELAIWAEDRLCGLALGRIRAKKVVATIHLLESNPGANPVSSRVGVIATRYIELLGMLIGCSEISIESPVDGLVKFYQALGFTKVVKKGNRVVRLRMILASVLSH